MSWQPVSLSQIGVLTVIGVGSNQVRIAIRAPEQVPIYREEIWLQMSEEDRVKEGVKRVDKFNK